MGRIICSKRGPSALALVCRHIEAAAREPRKQLVIKEVRGRLVDPQDSTLCRVCSDCYQGLPQVKGDEWLDVPEDRWPELVPMCGQCFHQFLAGLTE